MSDHLPAGVATGVGSLPGSDPLEAVRTVLGELPDMPHLPELPSRGPGADLMGRTAALLVDLHVDLQPSGWRLVARPGVDERRARDFLARDLDALESLAADWAGPMKCQVAGPWTLAAGVELTRGNRVLADAGALRDLHASLAEGVRAHLRDLRRRLPQAGIVVQVDEPGLPAVRDGRLPSASGFDTLAGVADHELVQGLSDLRRALDGTAAGFGVHCCADDPPLDLLADLRPDFASLDATLLRPDDDQWLGELVDRGVLLMLGVVSATDPGPNESGGSPRSPTPFAASSAADPVRLLWRRLSYPADRLGESVVVTPTCGLAGATPDAARTALARCREVARVLVEAPEATARAEGVAAGR